MEQPSLEERACDGDKAIVSYSYYWHGAYSPQPRGPQDAYDLKKCLAWKREKQPKKSRSQPSAISEGLVFSFWTEIISQNINIRQGHCVSRIDQDKNMTMLQSCQNTDNTWTLSKSKHTKHPLILAKMSDLSLATRPITTVASFSMPSFQIRFMKIPNQNYPTSWPHPTQRKALLPWILPQIT